MYREVSKWLKIQSMPVSENYLRLRLESHPDYPSLIAVQDTLSELNIECNAYQTSKEELVKTGKPFLIHLNMGEGNILSFLDMITAQRKVKDFDKHWSGVVMLADKCGKYGNPEHDRQYKQEKQNRFFSVAAIVLIVSVFIGIAVWNNSIAGLLLILSNAAGLYFSWLIVQKEFGISNSVSDKICSMAKHSSCESVLFSKGAKLFRWLTWGDVGIVYFASSLLYLLVSLLTRQAVSLQFYYILSFAGLLFPFYSLYYQWKIVNQWCMLCIAVLSILGLNTLIGLSFWQTTLTANSAIVKAAIAFFGIGVLLLFSWQLLKSLFRKSLLSLSNEISYNKLKRNPEIFKGLLVNEEANPANLPDPDEAIRFGSPSAPYQLVIACNPYCAPCAKAHQAVETLYEKFPGRFSISVRFTLHTNNDTDNRIMAAKEIMKVAKTKPFEAVKDWYSLFDIEKFKQAHLTNGLDVTSALEKHTIWGKKADIRGTPTFFINGRKLPEMYSWKDCTEILEFEIQK